MERMCMLAGVSRAAYYRAWTRSDPLREETALRACGDYIGRLEATGIQPSMSRAGCPYDNAMAESFMRTLKHEEVDASVYRDLAHARAAIGEFIETAYNRQRLDSALAYVSPIEFESNQPWAAAQQPRAMTQPSCP